jgi:hypothetical protein
MFSQEEKKAEKIQQDAKIETSHEQQSNSTSKIETSNDSYQQQYNSTSKIEPSREKHIVDISQLVTLYLENH